MVVYKVTLESQFHFLREFYNYREENKIVKHLFWEGKNVNLCPPFTFCKQNVLSKFHCCSYKFEGNGKTIS